MSSNIMISAKPVCFVNYVETSNKSTHLYLQVSSPSTIWSQQKLCPSSEHLIAWSVVKITTDPS